jgi:phage-related protein
MTALPYPEKLHNTSTVEYKDTISILELGDNYQQRVEMGINPQHEEWAILWPVLKPSEFASVLSTLNSVRCKTPLTWESPIDGVTRNYVVMPDSRKLTPLGGGRWSIGLRLRQVFNT